MNKIFLVKLITGAVAGVFMFLQAGVVMALTPTEIFYLDNQKKIDEMLGEVDELLELSFASLEGGVIDDYVSDLAKFLGRDVTTQHIQDLKELAVKVQNLKTALSAAKRRGTGFSKEKSDLAGAKKILDEIKGIVDQIIKDGLRHPINDMAQGMKNIIDDTKGFFGGTNEGLATLLSDKITKIDNQLSTAQQKSIDTRSSVQKAVSQSILPGRYKSTISSNRERLVCFSEGVVFESSLSNCVTVSPGTNFFAVTVGSGGASGEFSYDNSKFGSVRLPPELLGAPPKNVPNETLVIPLFTTPLAPSKPTTTGTTPPPKQNLGDYVPSPASRESQPEPIFDFQSFLDKLKNLPRLF